MASPVDHQFLPSQAACIYRKPAFQTFNIPLTISFYPRLTSCDRSVKEVVKMRIISIALDNQVSSQQFISLVDLLFTLRLSIRGLHSRTFQSFFYFFIYWFANRYIYFTWSVYCHFSELIRCTVNLETFHQNYTSTLTFYSCRVPLRIYYRVPYQTKSNPVLLFQSVWSGRLRL